MEFIFVYNKCCLKIHSNAIQTAEDAEDAEKKNCVASLRSALNNDFALYITMLLFKVGVA